MGVLVSNSSLANAIEATSFKASFESHLETTEKLSMAVGFVSVRALETLAKHITKKGKPYCHLVIGMHYFEQFTHSQYAAANELHQLLDETALGSVHLVTASPFHGKLYHFKKSNESEPSTTIIGSSNLSNITGSSLTEVDYMTDEPTVSDQVLRLITHLSTDYSQVLPNVPITTFKKRKRLFDGDEKHFNGVKHVEPVLFPEVNPIKLPLKPYEEAPQSNLNVYFGAPKNKQKPKVRNWYEVELIIPSNLMRGTALPQKGEPFKVITDDGVEFELVRQGDQGKNLRSKEDLQILGYWLKGRLEEAGVLSWGKPVTRDTLQAYGRDTISLYPPTHEGLPWLLDFSPQRA